MTTSITTPFIPPNQPVDVPPLRDRCASFCPRQLLTGLGMALTAGGVLFATAFIATKTSDAVRPVIILAGASLIVGGYYLYFFKFPVRREQVAVEPV